MRIVSYNILDGGIGRADPIAEVLLAQRPDVVGLVEADDPAILDRIAWRLGWDFISAPGRDGDTAALLTRGRILSSINHVPLAEHATPPRSFLEAVVRVDEKDLRIGLLHTSGRASEEREKDREKEIAFVLDRFKGAREANEPHVLMGDFNANSPHWTLVPDRLAKKTKKWLDHNGGHIPRRVIEAVEAAGYVDTFRAADPEAARVAATFTTFEPGQRLDYIFTYGFQPEAIRSAWIEQDRLAAFASDHFPVGAELG